MPRPRRASARPSSCTRLAGGKRMHLGILNSTSHVHVLGCAHAEAQKKNFNTPRLGLVSNKVRGSTSVCNEVYAKQQESQPSEFKAFLPWN